MKNKMKSDNRPTKKCAWCGVSLGHGVGIHARLGPHTIHAHCLPKARETLSWRAARLRRWGCTVSVPWEKENKIASD